MSLDLPKKTSGTLIRQVVEDGPSDNAGMEPGDVVIEANGKKIKKTSDLINLVGLLKPGTKIKIKYYRDGKLKSSQIKVGSWEKLDPSKPRISSNKPHNNPFGLTIEENSPALRKKYGVRRKYGVFIHTIKPDSPADRSGLKTGDLILTANGKKIRKLNNLEKLLGKKKRLLLRIQRESDFFFVPLNR
jgi:S1-C subfamily serine protease